MDIDLRIEAIRKEMSDWELLLQLDSDRDVGMIWGDCGMLHFWIRKQDAEQKDFSKILMTMRCC